MNQKLTEIAVSTEWAWMCEHWYVFAIGGIIIAIMLFIGGCMKTSGIASREEERLYDKLVSGEEYKQKDVEHK